MPLPAHTDFARRPRESGASTPIVRLPAMLASRGRVHNLHRETACASKEPRQETRLTQCICYGVCTTAIKLLLHRGPRRVVDDRGHANCNALRASFCNEATIRGGIA